ncbi:MAG: acyl-CoA/acyl-ACP dehydrogenase [Anaerolineae bacterium]|nr:acyl-CoA/acyl-ACP dehydrogenase [Anaerolineae bacterium]
MEGRDILTQVALSAGASLEEALAMGEVAGADDAANALYAPQYQTERSPVHQTMWDGHCPIGLFDAPKPAPLTGRAKQVMERAIDIVKTHQDNGSFLNGPGEWEGKIADGVVQDLGALGYYGALIPENYGGLGLDFPAFAVEETNMSIHSPSVAMQNSIHEGIGAVGPLLVFGNPEQKERLRALAAGRPQSCFALTESQGGSDLKNMRVRGVIGGDEIVIYDQKWFITNVYFGGLMCLVCMLEGPGLKPSPQVVMVDIPAHESKQFYLTRYKLSALQQLRNVGVNFNGLRVPLKNWIHPKNVPNGLTIAYHLLNRGRVSVAAVSAGRLRTLLAHMRLWGRTRISMGKPIDQRDLPLEDYARMAGLIVCADAFRDWTAWLLQQGYRGELECGAAKITVSRLMAEAADRIYPLFWGGRALDAAHPYSREVTEMKAAEIYEGHNNMLLLAYFAALTKQHSTQYMMPIFEAVQQAGIQEFNPLNLTHVMKVRGPATNYAKWVAGRLKPASHDALPDMPRPLQKWALRGMRALYGMGNEIDTAMRDQREQLVNRQGMVADLVSDVHQYIAMLVTSLHARHFEERSVQLAAETFCEEQWRRMHGGRRSAKQHAKLVELGKLVRDGHFSPIDNVPEGAVNMAWG